MQNDECRMQNENNSELCIMHSEFERSEERDGGLAQLGERLPCKQEVSGSIPLISTNMGQQLSWLEHTTDNREVDGSSPFWPTTSQLQIQNYKLQLGVICKREID